MRWQIDRMAALMALIAVLIAPLAGALAQADGTLVFAQPVLGALEDGQDILSYAYTAVQPTSLTLQVVSDSVAASIAIRDAEGLVAQEQNAAASLIVSLSTVLPAGTYTVDIASVNGVSGSVLVAIQDESPLVVQPIEPGIAITAEVSAAVPVSLFRFSAPAEPAVLTIDSLLTDGGPLVSILNASTRNLVARVAPEWTGADFSLPANGQTYELMITHSGRSAAEGYTLCLHAASTGCGGTSPVAQPEAQPAACTVTPLQAGGANIRQSASTNAPIASVLPGGQSASAIGISPDSAWFNVTFGSVIGWVARSAIVASGDCNGLPVVQPPSFQPVSQPTQPPAQPQPTQPSAQPQPPQPPPPTPIPTMSGPCLITVTSPTYIYTQPTADISYLGDQAQPAYQYIPNGRLADNSWWRLNGYNWWIQTSTFGGTVQVTGDCSGLPVVSP